ncbi:hypothetical protein [Aquitalea denitrificans]|uniref:hypothetical protein n=1 Tax=Aquitalea denitrificans TaxID=519081 RepID=UPI00196A9251|nr:hypothetical protein [Aquitalea denitrificans]
MTPRDEALYASLGFRFGSGGPHASRTMMLDDLRTLLKHVPLDAERVAYAEAVIQENILGKPTRKTRELSWKYLQALYGFDANPLFRALRRLWVLDEEAQPMLALTVTLARDPLLRLTQPYYLDSVFGTLMRRESMEAFLEEQLSGRLSAASLKSLAQNVAGSWTAAGILKGRARKVRSKPQATPGAVAMMLFMGYLEGRTGQRLFNSDWIALLGCSVEEVEALASSASHRGLIVYMSAGGVKEVRFPGYLTAEEEQIRQEAMHVV